MLFEKKMYDCPQHFSSYWWCFLHYSMYFVISLKLQGFGPGDYLIKNDLLLIDKDIEALRDAMVWPKWHSQWQQSLQYFLSTEFYSILETFCCHSLFCHLITPMLLYLKKPRSLEIVIFKKAIYVCKWMSICISSNN